MADRKKTPAATARDGQATREPARADAPPRIGGSFAPPIDAARLAAYRDLSARADDITRQAMGALIRMAEKFQETPPSTDPGTPHPSGRGRARPLSAAEVERIWDVVPWNEELEMYAGIFGRIDPVADRPLRDAAHHLLWYARELFLDREPMTTDTL
jgi:hypothetical protein